MRKYAACASVVVAAALMATPLAAGAQARQSQHAKQGKQGFILVNHHGARGSTMYVQRGNHSTRARAAACPAGEPHASYCTAPVEENLFGAYSWGEPTPGSATFGSNSSSVCQGLHAGYTSGPCGVYTTQPNELIMAFVSASGNGQNVTVSCKTYNGGACPVSFSKVKAMNSGGGDSEVWYADATNVISKTAPIFVTAKVGTTSGCGSDDFGGCDVSLQAVTFTNAIVPGTTGSQLTGIGASNACFSTHGAPTCSLTTTQSSSLIWASLNNPSASTIPTWPSSQFAIGVSDPSAGNNGRTFYSQFLGKCIANQNGSKPCSTMPLPSSGLYQNPFQILATGTPTWVSPGINETINDTAPTNNAFNEVVVEIV